MVKGISAINGIGRKAIMGAVLAGSMFLCASSPIKNVNKDKEPQQTELMSNESSEVLKVNALMQNTLNMPTVHNKELDETFLRFAENEEERQYIKDFLDRTYNKYGTYMASSLIQSEIDFNMFLNCLEGNVDIINQVGTRYKASCIRNFNNIKKENPNVMENIKAKKDILKTTIEEYFNSVNMLSRTYDGIPDYETASRTLDNIVSENFPRKVDDYDRYVSQYKQQQLEKYNDSTSITRQLNLIAYKQYLSDQFFIMDLISKKADFKILSPERDFILSVFLIAVVPNH